MKKVLLTSDPAAALRAMDSYDGVQLGAEFCYRKLPAAGGISRVIGECIARDKSFSLVTPVLSEPGLARLKRLIKDLRKHAPFEVVVNDFGAFDIVADAGLIPVAGRLIVKQKSDPRLASVPRGLLREFSKKSACDNSAFRAVLAELGVTRIEMDNPLADISLPGDFRVSMHYPYVFLTMKMNCAESHCARCGEIYTLKSPQVSTDIVLRGNAQFYFNGRLPDTFGIIDRLVCHEEPPA